ncbi:SGNH/GDSL hydrolase family protein [Bradyrhizobium sp. CB3481]|uniref:SGNH/GDSL hydrolase family protein n=1 Tax=Bradyrhizobium sp. CB3481 TaxID=3039158 RepID=UPI0024B1C666|nr:SGNH/GDSL hydrolase family protein [Bradyrhizobium sp. CB3481]WFU15902.1 SGNH/GDSL hydrolase family protein [Bradyrhizobium sp. CB3481]
MKYAFGRALSLVAVVAFSLVTLPASASIYNSLVVFGDSLSDSGNNAILIGANPGQTITGNTYVPSQPYGSGAYSNGPVWASSVATQLGVPLLPSLAGGTNYAYGGATTGPAGNGFPFSLLTQANQYLAANSASANALYVIAGGGNDARAALAAIAACGPGCPGPTVAATIAATATQYANNVGSIINALQASGAQHIVVWNTPNLGLAPAVTAAGASALGTLLAASMNAALAAQLSLEPDVKAFDIFTLGTTIALNPGAFGFTNVTDACGAIVGANCATYAYWDGIHPTAAAHEKIAEAFLAVTAVPEPSTWFMMVVGFGFVGFVAYRRRPQPGALAAA